MKTTSPDLILRNTREGDVGAALNLLREALGEEEKRIRDEGARAMVHGDFDTAKVVVDFAERLQSFTAKVESLGTEWGGIEQLRDRSTPEVQKIVSKRIFGRQPKGNITPQSAFKRPILEVLVEMGGGGKTEKVLDRVGAKMARILKPIDLERHKSDSNQIRWRNTAMWARNDMANKDGRMKNDSPTGYWEISDKGRAWLCGGRLIPSRAVPLSRPLRLPLRKKETQPATAGARPSAADCSSRNAEGRDCARHKMWEGYELPCVRPPRGMTTPDGYDVSLWTEGVGRGAPLFCVRDVYNVNQVRSKGIHHSAMRSLCVAGVAFAERGDGSFDPATNHSFVIDGDNTFIVW